MAAKCIGCGEKVSSNPYPDEQLLAGACVCCDAYLCATCLGVLPSSAQGAMCSECWDVVEAP